MKTWFITGTSGGFGYMLTKLLLERGDRVAATARQIHKLDDLKETYGDQLWTHSLDVTNVQAIHQVVKKAFEDLGEIHVVVNNAGYGLFGAVEEVSDEQITHQVNTNVIGSIQVIRASLPYLRKQGGGRILQLSSSAGQTGLPGISLYNTSKWAIEGFIESLVQEVAPFNIQATLIEPGSAKTNFSGSSLVIAAPKKEYEETAVGYMRNMTSENDRLTPGDPMKMVQAMVSTADADIAPLRVTLGSDAYNAIHKSLTERIKLLESQKELAQSTDFINKA
ncbi:SDR family oxidoreductase [Bacillus altitudinis]|uniref:SDR family oxidoreductase n=1 Tax=Bacillus altitudinis TaxID=293387 RepID=UPI0037C760FE